MQPFHNFRSLMATLLKKKKLILKPKFIAKWWKYLPGPGICLSSRFIIIFSCFNSPYRATKLQKNIQSSRHLWFMMITEFSLFGGLSPVTTILTPNIISVHWERKIIISDLTQISSSKIQTRSSIAIRKLISSQRTSINGKFIFILSSMIFWLLHKRRYTISSSVARRHKLILGKLTRILDSTFPNVYFLVILVRENFVFNLFLTVNKKHVLEQKKSARNINLSWSQNIFRFETNSVV